MSRFYNVMPLIWRDHRHTRGNPAAAIDDEISQEAIGDMGSPLG